MRSDGHRCAAASWARSPGAADAQAGWDGAGRRPASLNQPIGPHRRFETVRLDLGRCGGSNGALGGTVNDVIWRWWRALRSLLAAARRAPTAACGRWFR